MEDQNVDRVTGQDTLLTIVVCEVEGHRLHLQGSHPRDRGQPETGLEEVVLGRQKNPLDGTYSS